jgi:D-aminopeptidase
MIDKSAYQSVDTAWEVKRKMRIPALADSGDDAAVEQALAGIEGVLRVAADHAKKRVAVTYLVTKTDYQSLERAAEAAGFAPAGSRWARMKSGWYQNLDVTGRENAHAPAAACGNKPPTKGH